MSFAATNWAWELEGLTPTQKLVLVGLANYADENNSCFPGQELLAEHAGVSVRTVRSIVKHLEKIGVLTRKRRYNSEGMRTSDRYVLSVGMTLPEDIAGSGYRKSDATLPATDDTLPEIGRNLTGSPLPGNSKRTVSKNSKKNHQLSAREIKALFDDAYSSWPKKEKRKESLDKFITKSKKRDPYLIASDIKRFADAYIAAGKEKRYVPALVVWLNGERWDDELPSTPQDNRFTENQSRGLGLVQALREQESGFAEITNG